MPSHLFIMATDELTTAQASMLMQLCMRHIPLNQFLHRIGKIDSLLCLACTSAEETVHHYIFDYPLHAYACYSLARKLGCQSTSLRYVLGDKHTFKPYWHTYMKPNVSKEYMETCQPDQNDLQPFCSLCLPSTGPSHVRVHSPAPQHQRDCTGPLT